ncbi:DUF1659 domain-containing protein [Aminiphilus sp.]|uniref:DUF1659 domain-containing protein n=1 Tax=Aminiphilus sp. TaxID=1872488 RepID=UPI003445D3C9
MVLKVQTGSDEWGKPKTKSLSWSASTPPRTPTPLTPQPTPLRGSACTPETRCRSWPPTS